MNQPLLQNKQLLRLELKQRKTCRVCGSEFPQTPCAFTHFGRELRYGTLYLARIQTWKQCPYCGAPKFSTHHLGCPVEKCPDCDALSFECDCEFDFVTSLSLKRKGLVYHDAGRISGYKGERSSPCPP